MKHLGLVVLTVFALGCKSDPCKDILCENESRCNNGVCECAFGYDGSTCENELFGTSLTIDSIVIFDYPDHPSLATWDPPTTNPTFESRPDVFFRIFSYYIDPLAVADNTQLDWNENYNGIDEGTVLPDLALFDLPVTVPINLTVTEIRTIYNWEFQVEDYEGLTATYMANVETDLINEVNGSGLASILLENGDFQIRVFYTIIE